MHIGFIGLGNVGVLLAANLVEAGYGITVHDLDRSRATELIARGATWAGTAREAAEVGDVLITCLPTPQAVSQVMEGPDGAFDGLRPGAVWIETSTTDADEVKRLAALAADKGIQTLEATLTLGVHRMKARTATVFAGGDEATVERLRPLLEAMAGQVILMGPLGHATVIKVITNLLAFINLIGSAEGLMLAQRAGIDPGRAHAAIAASYGTSYAHETAMPVALGGSYDDGFALELACKDLHLGQKLADQLELDLELTDATAKMFETVRQTYGDRAFSTEAVRYVEDKAGEPLRATGFPSAIV
jgi:3-hydroxyisobutyrate dehydrogenase